MSEAESPELSILDNISYGKTVRRQVNEFAATFALVMCLFAIWKLWKHDAVLDGIAIVVAALVLLLVGYKKPKLLVPVWRSWMALGTALAFIMTPVIMTVLWILLVIPTALLLRIFRIRVVDMSYKTDASSYWIDRKEGKDDFKLLGRQF